MKRNLISNGNFETRNFESWTVTESGGRAKVVIHKNSYRAEIRVGKHEKLRLDTGRFRAGPGEFDLSLQASMPELKTEDTAVERQDPPIMFCTLFGWSSAEPLPVVIMPIFFWLSQPRKLYEHHGVMPPGVENVQLIIAFESVLEPALTGPIYLDNVKFKADLAR